MKDSASRDALKRIIAKYLVRYPLRYCTPVFIGVASQDEQTMHSNGTATWLRIGQSDMIVTDDHVLWGYECAKRQDSRVEWQVGEARFDPFERLIDRNGAYELPGGEVVLKGAKNRASSKDLCTFDARGLDIAGNRLDDSPDALPPLQPYIVEGSSWPPPIANVGEVVILGGFPGVFRLQDGLDVLSKSWSVAAIPITGFSADQFSCKLDRSEWQNSEGSEVDSNIHLLDLGGMSGGPVLRDGPGMLRPTLAGFIKEHNEDLDQLVVSHAALISKEGKIEKGSIL